MVSKKNIKLIQAKLNRTQFHFGLRKLNVGVASVLLGVGIGLGVVIIPTTQVQADVTAASTTTPANQTVVDDQATTNEVTLQHGDNETRNVTISAPVVAGDIVEVSVPEIFQASTDNDTTGQYYDVQTKTQAVNDLGYQTSKVGSQTTFTYTAKSTRSIEFNVKLTPTVADWSFLPAGKQYVLSATKNGNPFGAVTYTIGQPAVLAGAKILFDQNQTTNLVVGQKYSVGLQLANTGAQDGDNFAGTIVLDVPTGFVVDQSSDAAFGLNGGRNQV
ncbi:MAG: YSIRK-type signal peptide-containing protein, partial [Limosilactobacillus sp.]|nr:YSIRK-type signal peptide-containing protein [Limosilactobacillus sp.]